LIINIIFSIFSKNNDKNTLKYINKNKELSRMEHETTAASRHYSSLCPSFTENDYCSAKVTTM
jgi:hypothetical protein